MDEEGKEKEKEKEKEWEGKTCSLVPTEDSWVSLSPPSSWNTGSARYYHYRYYHIPLLPLPLLPHTVITTYRYYHYRYYHDRYYHYRYYHIPLLRHAPTQNCFSTAILILPILILGLGVRD